VFPGGLSQCLFVKGGGQPVAPVAHKVKRFPGEEEKGRGEGGFKLYSTWCSIAARMEAGRKTTSTHENFEKEGEKKQRGGKKKKEKQKKKKNEPGLPTLGKRRREGPDPGTVS